MRPFSASRTSWTASGRSEGAFQAAWASRGQVSRRALPAAYRSLKVPVECTTGAGGLGFFVWWVSWSQPWVLLCRMVWGRGHTPWPWRQP